MFLRKDSACQTHCRSIHSIRKSTMRDWRSGGISVPSGTFHHLAMQLRQQHAQACCALKTGCPRMGVCLPSFGGCAGASFVRTKSSACRNRDRNFDLDNLAKAASCALRRVPKPTASSGIGLASESRGSAGPGAVITSWRALPGPSCCGGSFRMQIPLRGSRRWRRTSTTAC